MHRPRLAGPVRSSVVPGLGEVADRYDAVLLDQFGVLHDGKRSIAGAEDCYKRLAEAGKKLIVLSNTSRRRDFAVKRLPSIAIGRIISMFKTVAIGDDDEVIDMVDVNLVARWGC